MKAVVVYKSKTGFTKKYAEWITEALSADILEASKVKADSLINYDTIIYGGSLYAAGINGVKLITQNLDKLKGKKVLVYGVGASPSKENVLSDVTEKNFSKEQQKYIKFFYFRGGFNYSKLNPFDKFLMSIMKWSIMRKKAEDRTEDEKGMLGVYDKPVDFTSKENIKELLDYVNS